MLTRNPFRWTGALLVLALSTPILAFQPCAQGGDKIVMVLA